MYSLVPYSIDYQFDQDLLPAVFALVNMYVVYAKSCLLGQLTVNVGVNRKLDAASLKAFGAALAIASTRAPAKVSSLGISVISKFIEKLWLCIPAEIHLQKKI